MAVLCAAMNLLGLNNCHYDTDFGVSSAEGAGNTKIVFWKARHRRAFQKLIFIMRIAGLKPLKKHLTQNLDKML